MAHCSPHRSTVETIFEIKVISEGKRHCNVLQCTKIYNACFISKVLFSSLFRYFYSKETVILKLFQINVFLYIMTFALWGMISCERKEGSNAMQLVDQQHVPQLFNNHLKSNSCCQNINSIFISPHKPIRNSGMQKEVIAICHQNQN